MKKYTETHEWIEVKDGIGTVGITNYAQRELGVIVYVELPQKGAVVKGGEEVVVLESTKAAADVYTPVSGIIHQVNNLLKEDSEMVNRFAESEGWLYQIQLSHPEELNTLKDSEN
jgi:glycine cleavage system H protein